jgi:NAD(P)-dependent dehydrogenase (short-subunit alcohol dehydrogenase family)
MDNDKKGAVLVTGASTGIGRSSALLLDRSGYKVFAGVRNMEVGEQIRDSASKRLSPVLLDVTKPEQIANAFKSVQKSLGPDDGLFGLVNNAGICIAGPTEYLPVDILRQHLEVNVIGHIAVIQAFMPLIRAGHGRIINIGSPTGRFSLPYLGAYSGSKHAMVALTDALRIELRSWKIPVSVVEPGTVETPMWVKSTAKSHSIINDELPAEARNLYQEMTSSIDRVMDSGRKRAIFPDDVAATVLKAISAKRPKNRYMVGAGSRMAIIGNILPSRFTDWVFAMVLAKKLPTKVLGW